MFNKPCQKCAALESQLAYMKDLVDKLLAKNGISTINEAERIIEESEDVKRRRAVEQNGGQVYGEL